MTLLLLSELNAFNVANSRTKQMGVSGVLHAERVQAGEVLPGHGAHDGGGVRHFWIQDSLL